MLEQPFDIAEWNVRPSELVIQSGEEIRRLEPKAMSVLQLLAERAPEVVSIEEMLSKVWAGTVVGDNAVYRAIALLRRALGDTSRSSRFIESIARKGYRLKVEVNCETTPKLAAETPPVVGNLVIALDMTQGAPQRLGTLTTELARYLSWAADAFRVQLQPSETQSADYLIRMVAEDGALTRYQWELYEQQLQSLLWSGHHLAEPQDGHGSLQRVAEMIADGAAEQIRRHKLQHLATRTAGAADDYWSLILTSDQFEGVSIENVEGRRQRLKQAMALFPKLAPAYAAYGDLCSWEILNGVTSDARKAYQSAHEAVANAIELDRDSPYVLSRCGAVLARLGDYQRGTELCQRAFELAPSASSKEALARVLTFAGEPDRAIPLLEDIIRTMPRGHVFRYGKVVVPLVQDGQLGAAMDYSIRFISSYPNDFYAWVLHCNLAFQLGDGEAGLNAWREVQRLSPGLKISDTIAATIRTYGRTPQQQARLTDGLRQLEAALADATQTP